MRQRLLILGLLSLAVACGGADPSPEAGSVTEASDASAANAGASTVPDDITADDGHDHGAPAPAAAGTPEKRFPDLEYLAQIPVAYRNAKRHPDLLAQIPCYCPCMLYGHGALVDCHRSQHSAACATCLEEAVLAGQLLENAGNDPARYPEVAAQVKNRYRTAVVRNELQSNEKPGLQTDGGRAYLQVCSDCHQPAHPAMYTTDAWRQPLARMEAYARQRGTEPDPQIWSQAVDYIRSTAGQFPAEAGDQFRGRLAQAVDHLKAAEGESVYYPSSQDPVLDDAWFERMVRAYRLARDIPAADLAAVSVEDPACTNLLQCLNTSAAVTSEAAVEAVERLAAERGIGD